MYKNTYMGIDVMNVGWWSDDTNEQIPKEGMLRFGGMCTCTCT
jgi:hypothetical protein